MRIPSEHVCFHTLDRYLQAHESLAFTRELDPQQKARYRLFLDAPTPHQRPFQQSPKPGNFP